MPSQPTDERVLEERLAELSHTDCRPEVLAEVRRLLVEGSDLDAYKVNAFRVADALALPRREVLRGLLLATRVGLLDLHWDVHCPACRGLPAFEKHLMGLRNTAHCGLCEIDWELDFEEQVEVTFTANEEVRPLGVRHFKDRDFEGCMEYFGEVPAREGRLFTASDCVWPEEPAEISGSFAPGRYFHYNAAHREKGGEILVREGPSEDSTVEVVMTREGGVSPERLDLPPGTITFRVTSEYPKFEGFLVKDDQPLRNWVSAAYVTALQDFRDLFSGEFLAPDISFAIRGVTLMFTDLKSSTEMYEVKGDSRAYALVQEHFRVMTGIIRRHQGGIVKTIGDAVMASFPGSLHGVRAALDMQREFQERAEELEGLELKIGLHRGPAIAVTSNRALDFFGRTVNLAARVQGASDAGEVLASGAVVDGAAVRAALEESGVSLEPRKVALKGIADDVEVYALV